jgi:hypothetical protein
MFVLKSFDGLVSFSQFDSVKQTVNWQHFATSTKNCSTQKPVAAYQNNALYIFMVFRICWRFQRFRWIRGCCVVCNVVLVNIAGFNATLNWRTFVNDWMYLQTWGIFLFTVRTKEVHQKHGNGLYKKILKWTGTGEWMNVDKWICVVTGGRLNIGKFWNSRLPKCRLSKCRL